MAVLVLALGAVTLTVSGNQSLLSDTETNAEALSLAQGLIEENKAVSRKDFRLVVATSSNEGAYQKNLTVSENGFFTKLLSASVRWKIGIVDHEITLSTLIADVDSSVGGTTCTATLLGDWAHPVLAGFAFASLAHDAGGVYAVSDIDANQGRLYASVNTPVANSKPTFFIFDIKNTQAPVLLGAVDTAPVSAGISAIAVATSSARNYAYAANAYDANFRTCKPGPSCAQLQVIDISNPALPAVVANYELPTSSPPYVLGNGGGGNAVGKSIFYKNGYVYLGLSKTTSGPEFHIIDVKDPLHPAWVGSYPPAGTSSGNAVNAVFIQRTHAYLATPNAQELTVLDISNPANPVLVGTYDASGGSGNGKSLDVVGDTLYMGRTVGNKEFYVLDVANPATPSLLGQVDTGNATVSGVVIRDYLAFLGVGNQFQIWNVGNLAHAVSFATPLALPNGSSATAIDCEGNTLYAASVAANTGFLSVISAP